MITGVRRIWGPVRLVSKLISSIAEGIITAINKLFYFVSGRQQEMLADEFAAYLGFEKDWFLHSRKTETAKQKD